MWQHFLILYALINTMTSLLRHAESDIMMTQLTLPFPSACFLAQWQQAELSQFIFFQMCVTSLFFFPSFWLNCSHPFRTECRAGKSVSWDSKEQLCIGADIKACCELVHYLTKQVPDC